MANAEGKAVHHRDYFFLEISRVQQMNVRASTKPNERREEGMDVERTTGKREKRRRSSSSSLMGQ